MKITRRDLLKTSAAAWAVSSFGSFFAHAADPLYAGGAPTAEKMGWRVGCQLYSFHTKSFREAVEMNASLGLNVAEAFPTHRLTPENDAPLTADLSAADKKLVQKILADNGVCLHGFGVVSECDRKTFDFVKEMGIETITCEPPIEAFDDIEKLVEEYDVKIAIHNHPKPSSAYWDYRTILKVCEGRDSRIGACVDVNHLMRSDLNPLEALRALKGRIVSFHFGDLNQYGPLGHDVPLGTGVGQTAELLRELYAQKFQGVFAFEYEANIGENLSDIAECVKYFESEAKKLV